MSHYLMIYPHLQKWGELSQCKKHEVSLCLGEAPHTVSEELLRSTMKFGKLIQQLGIQGLVVVPCCLQLFLHTFVFQPLGSLLTVIIVKQLVETLLDQFVWTGKHGKELGEGKDDQSLRPLLLLTYRHTPERISLLGSFMDQLKVFLHTHFVRHNSIHILL